MIKKANRKFLTENDKYFFFNFWESLKIYYEKFEEFQKSNIKNKNTNSKKYICEFDEKFQEVFCISMISFTLEILIIQNLFLLEKFAILSSSYQSRKLIIFMR